MKILLECKIRYKNDMLLTTGNIILLSPFLHDYIHHITLQVRVLVVLATCCLI